MSFFSSLFSLLKPAPPPDPDVLKALERIGVLVDPLLPNSPGFEKTLTLPVRNALDYCRRIVDQIPGPCAVNRQSFSSDPLVHALFATADDIRHMLGKSASVREYLKKGISLENDCFHALLAARRQSKKALGVALEGDIVRSDVPLEYLFFSEHVLIDSALGADECRTRICEKTFDGLLRSFRSHLDSDREKRQELRDNRDIERGQISLLRGQGTYVELDAHTRRVGELEKNLEKMVDALQPAEIIEALANFLMVPESAMQIEPVSVPIDRTGVIQPATQGATGVENLRFEQFTGRDRRRYIVLIACIRRADAAEAVAEMQDLQHRNLII